MDNYENPKPGKTYISPSLPSFGNKEVKIRIASKSLMSSDGLEYAKERDEVVVRKKVDAATHIRAKFLEDSRGLYVLTVQKFDTESGQPYGSGFSFVGDEIERFVDFLHNIRHVQFKSSGPLNISDDDLKRIAITSPQARRLVEDNEEVFTEIVRNSLTKEDVVAIAYRKRQLDVFGKLLNDPDFFDEVKLKKECSNEALWQLFFEKNPWIFGYGLSYVYTSGLDGEQLEQVVKGHAFNSFGKRVDALLKTKAIASTLCFVEIKTHRTSLLSNSAYRRGCWAPSTELSGAVSQVQVTASVATEAISGKLQTTDSSGFPTDEVLYNFRPRSFVVAGSLDEFSGSHGINEDKLRSFELYRSNIFQPEIITFDELYERASHIVQTSATAR